MRWFGLGAIVLSGLLGVNLFVYACGSMEETAPGVFEGTGKYEGTYRLAEPGETADVSVRTLSGIDDGNDFLRANMMWETTSYIKLEPGELAAMTEAEKEEAEAKSQAAIPQPPPLMRVSPSRLKLTVKVVEEAKPEKATQKADEEDLILL